MKELSFSDESWAAVLNIASKTGLPPEKVVGRAIAAYAVILEMYDQQGYPEAELKVIGKKKRIIWVRSGVSSVYNSVRGLLGLDDREL